MKALAQRVRPADCTSPLIRLCVVLTCALLVGACGKSEPALPMGSADQATLNYGYGIVPSNTVSLQPGVIVVGGGPRSIRSASADGRVWIIDGHAPHARELRPGNIMMVTSRATGRIMNVEPRGDDLAVTLGPFHLGDILRNADIKADVALNGDDVAYQVVPEVPGMYRDYANPNDTAARAEYLSSLEPTIEENASRVLLRFAPISFAKAQSKDPWSQSNKNLPPTIKNAPKVTIAGWELEPSWKHKGSNDRVGLKIQRNAEGKPLRVGIDLGIWLNDAHVKTRTVYRNGKLDTDSSTVVVTGLEGVDMNILSGISKANENKKVRIEVPFTIDQPIPPALTEGIPFIVQFKFKFIFETALGGNNATLEAAGKYKLKGPLGVENGKLIAPEVSEEKSMLDSVNGTSLGVSGYIFTQETRVLFGLGPPEFFTGPYVKIITAAGITKAAVIAAGLGDPQCRAVTVKFDFGGGWGVQMRSSWREGLEKLLGKKGTAEWEVAEYTATNYNKTFIRPKIPACRLL